MNWGRAIVAHFLAVEAAALFICMWLVLREGDFSALSEGVRGWWLFQLAIVAFAFISMPFLVMLRYALRKVNSEPSRVSVVAGSYIGAIIGLVVGLSLGDTNRILLLFEAVLVCSLAGCIAGYVWFKVERPQRLETQ